MKNKVKAHFLNIEKADVAAGRVKALVPGVQNTVSYHAQPNHFWNTNSVYALPLPTGSSMFAITGADGTLPADAVMVGLGSDSALLSGGDELGAREAVLEITTDGNASRKDVERILIGEGAYGFE